MSPAHLLPADSADELARLQDRVPPFDSAIAIETIERASKAAKSSSSPSNATGRQRRDCEVHSRRARQHGKLREVDVKVGRPGMLPVIEKDLALIRMMRVGETCRRRQALKPRE